MPSFGHRMPRPSTIYRFCPQAGLFRDSRFTDFEAARGNYHGAKPKPLTQEIDRLGSGIGKVCARCEAGDVAEV